MSNILPWLCIADLFSIIIIIIINNNNNNNNHNIGKFSSIDG